MLNVMARNYFTTTIGAILAGLYYVQTIGIKLPSTAGEWVQAAVGLGIAVLGFVAKDATTGSLPPSARLIVVALLVGGCASTTPGTPPPDPVAALSAFTVTDLQAALDQARADGDQAGINCWSTLLPLVQTTSTALPPIKGVASAIQAKRHLFGAGQAGVKNLATLVNVGCAAIFNSEVSTLIKIGVATSGGVAGVPGLPAWLP